MPLDQYSPCPCGSGKKLKFCKCVEQPQDYEKLMRLIEGGQELAAMDRINQTLAKTPNAAWLLALKGELALGMGELDTFRETANRFSKLKPDNPLAMIMMSIATALAGEPERDAAKFLLSGLAESRESLPSLTLTAIGLLIRRLSSSGKIALAGYWAEVEQVLSGNEEQQESILLDEELNLICKVAARLVDDPPNAPWKERLAEVISLSRIFCFAQAETKLRSILRDYPDSPGPLSHLLRAQMAQLDREGAVSTAFKLAENSDVPLEQRGYYEALGLILEEDSRLTEAVSMSHYCEVDSLERLQEILGARADLREPSGEDAASVRQYFAAMVGDEVPAKVVYSLFDKPLKAKEVTTADSAEPSIPAEGQTPREIASAFGTVVLYGKQTDKPARLLLTALRLPKYQSVIDELMGSLHLGPTIEMPAQQRKMSISSMLKRPRFVIGSAQPPSLEDMHALFIEEALTVPCTLFDGASASQVAGDPQWQIKLLGWLCYLEGQQDLIVSRSTFPELYQRLGLQRPTPQISIGSENMSIHNILDFERVDFEQFQDHQLRGLLFRCMSLAASRVVYHCANHILQRTSMAEDYEALVNARTVLREVSNNLLEKLVHTQALLKLLEQIGAPVGRTVIELFTLQVGLGHTQEAQATLREALQKHPEDPYLISLMQQLVSQQRGPAMPQAAASDELSSRMLQHATRADSSSGLILPGQETPAAAGGSKLWLPGA